MARWVRQMPQTFLEAGGVQAVGRIAAGIYGSLGDMASPRVPRTATSTICGNISSVRRSVRPRPPSTGGPLAAITYGTELGSGRPECHGHVQQHQRQR